MASPLPPTALDVLLNALDAASGDQEGNEVHLRAFIAWITGDANARRVLATLASDVATLNGAARTYRHVAVLGYAGAMSPGLDPIGEDALFDGLSWLAGREWFTPGRVPTFEADAIALLGVALGTAENGAGLAAPSVRRSQLRAWVATLLTQSRALAADQWERGLVELAQFAIDRDNASAARVWDAAPDLAASAAAKGFLSGTGVDENAALECIFALTYREHYPERAAAQRAAIRWLYRALPTALSGRASVSDALALISGVHRSLRRWRWEEAPSTRNAPLVRWQINNEYHVQDLLWVVLAPVFPDLEDEENLPSLGQKHPRYDLGVPSLKLIVEVKFIYRGQKREFSDLIEQVAADASLYLRDKGRYAAIVVVVWDESRHTEQHSELEQGLLAIAGVEGVVVLTRPGQMGPGLRADKGLRSGLVAPDEQSSSDVEKGVPTRRRQGKR